MRNIIFIFNLINICSSSPFGFCQCLCKDRVSITCQSSLDPNQENHMDSNTSSYKHYILVTEQLSIQEIYFH